MNLEVLTGTILAATVLSSGVASAETSIYEDTIEASNRTQQVDSETVESIKPIFVGENINIRLSSLNGNYSKNYSDLTLFKRYKLEISPPKASYISINFKNGSINQFLDEVGGHPTHLRAITFPEERTLFFQRNENLSQIDRSYRLRVYPSRTINFGLFAARSPESLKKQTLAINPSRTNCGYYWNPNSSFQEVNESCQEFREDRSEESTSGTSTDQAKIPVAILVVISIVFVTLGYFVAMKILKLLIMVLIRRKTDEILERAKLTKSEPNETTLAQMNEARRELDNGNFIKAIRKIKSVR